MQYHAACEECNRMECNENVENALECIKMHMNAYGKKPHHFREKTPLIPPITGGKAHFSSAAAGADLREVLIWSCCLVCGQWRRAVVLTDPPTDYVNFHS